MNDFDDDLRRLLGDDRLALTPRADAVGRIVKGAHRRRTIRVVASAAGSVGLVAAVALGSMAVTGQFSAGPDLEPGPAGTTTPLDPDLPVIGPTGLGEIEIGMTIEELEAVPGVMVREFSADAGRSEQCYGEFRQGPVYGLISHQFNQFSGRPVDEVFRVSFIGSEEPLQTPAGITNGATEDQVRAVHANLEVTSAGSHALIEGSSTTSYAFDGIFEDPAGGPNTVRSISLDGGQACAG